MLITLAFGFNDGKKVFELGFWLANFLRITLIVSVAILVKELVRKLVAKQQGFETEYKLWKISKFTFKPVAKPISIFGYKLNSSGLPIGAMCLLLVMIMSMGKLFFVAIGSYDLVLNKKSRFGKKTVHITDYEEAKIAIVGPLVSLGLMILFQLFNSSGMFDKFVLINGVLALYHMLPIPDLDGAKVFFGSKILYFFTIAFMVATALLATQVSPIIALILAIIFATIFIGVYYYHRIY